MRVITPALVELGDREPRVARHGGSAFVLLSEEAEDLAKNITLCREVFRAFDRASAAEVQAGERRGADGEIELLRPLYWLLRETASGSGGDTCASRVDRYHFSRAARIRRKLGITGRGPYLVVARADEKRAGLIDFATVPAPEVDDMVRYFRDAFAQEDDVWLPERHTPERSQARLTAFLGRAPTAQSLPQVVLITIVRAGCPLGDPFDVCDLARP